MSLMNYCLYLTVTASNDHIFNAKNGSLYMYVNNSLKVTWMDAENICLTKHGHLARISSAEDMNIIHKWLIQMTLPKRFIYIGNLVPVTNHLPFTFVIADVQRQQQQNIGHFSRKYRIM